MPNNIRKIRKLLRDPVLFVADSQLVRGPLDALMQRRASWRGKSAPKTAGTLLSNALFRDRIDFVVYFPAKYALRYQVEQWLPAFKALEKRGYRVMLLTRELRVHAHFAQVTRLPVLYCRTLADLMRFYEENDVRCVLYVNNAAKNFQSLINHRALHVHVNHGESEKSSMHSNQAKAYDYVFVVGEAGLDRYRRHLMKFDETAFIKVGRPQLDGITPLEHPIEEGRRVVMYAPTWAAHHASMNYSSIADHGEQIARAFVDKPDWYFIYRPHPSVGTTSVAEREADGIIKDLVSEAENAALITGVDINRVFPLVDVSIMDNSSVLIDYLRWDRPLLVTNRFPAGEAIPRITRAGSLLEPADFANIEEIVRKQIEQDPDAAQRRAEREHYLGNYAEGESTEAFIAELERILEERDQAWLELQEGAK